MLHVQQPDSSLYARHGELEAALKRAVRRKERGFAVGMFLVLASFTLFFGPDFAGRPDFCPLARVGGPCGPDWHGDHPAALVLAALPAVRRPT